ncbi:DNA mismatch repair protein MutL [Linderina pennispora]|uniref:DNA mismatch repair protein MutL n=1 Tax=Linderina pennispora TaxID=61395 RepID=A0A1Y1WI50_9FUNG|nr:DNA mismatch repair protein MutL [Linderina pennispora]ORX73251.1 DNA mismatch repair protein MutL [Linderina pennispora]
MPLDQTGPAPIRKLDTTVINRIAAGEIINRPSNALKELIENSLDAGATSISVNVKDGGLKVLQIQDNGHGIRTEDLPLVCERFTTSKLRVYEDLQSIHTYGFRGEALASISHVSHLSIVTKQAGTDCAYRAHYIDGKLAPPKPGASADPEPCAGNPGTMLTAEDLFYNIPSRLKALKNTREEYNRIYEVASRYAIHNSGVAFTCRKIGAPKADLNTLPGATTISNIPHGLWTKRPEFSFRGYVSSATHDMSKSVMLLFINHRLVDHTPIKRALDALYSGVLPKSSKPFVYLDLQIKPEHVDVNVHPAKREVRFLHEDEIIESYAIQTTLVKGPSGELAHEASNAEDRPVSEPATTPVIPRTAASTSANALPVDPPAIGSTPRKTPVNRAVRTNYKTLSLDSFSFGNSPTIRRTPVQTRIQPDMSVSPIRSPPPKRRVLEPSPTRTNRNIETSLLSRLDRESSSASTPTSARPASATSPSPQKGAPAKQLSTEHPEPADDLTDKSYTAAQKDPRVEVRLTSILGLRRDLQRHMHPELTRIMSEHTFVGFIDDRRALIQYSTRLYMIDYCRVSYHLFYHRCLPLRQSMTLAMAAATELKPEDPEKCAQEVLDKFRDSREMLEEYFHIKISDIGTIETLPMVVPGLCTLTLINCLCILQIVYQRSGHHVCARAASAERSAKRQGRVPDDGRAPHTGSAEGLVILGA